MLAYIFFFSIMLNSQRLLGQVPAVFSARFLRSGLLLPPPRAEREALAQGHLVGFVPKTGLELVFLV